MLKSAKTEEQDGRLGFTRLPTSWMRWAFAFLAVFVCAELGARLLEATVDPPSITWYDAATEEKVAMMATTNVDVAFVGTSMAWQAFVPFEFTGTDLQRRSSFHAGLAGAVPPVMERWILEEVEPTVEPDLVVWGLSSLDFAPAYGDVQVRAYNDAVATKRSVFASADRALRQVSAFFRIRAPLRRPSSLFGAEAERTRADIKDARATLGRDGERLVFDEDTSERLGALNQARLADYAPSTRDAESVARTVSELRRRGVSVLLVQLPVPERFVNQHPNGAADHALTRAAINRLGEDLGVNIAHLEHVFEDDDFVDFTHLDQDAAARASRLLAATIERIDSVPTGTCADVGLTDELGFPLPIDVCRHQGAP